MERKEVIELVDAMSFIHKEYSGIFYKRQALKKKMDADAELKELLQEEYEHLTKKENALREAESAILIARDCY